MNQAIDLYQKLNDPIAAIERLGTMFAKSGMFGCDRAEQGQVLAMICLAEHKSPVAINRDYDIVEGKLRKKALAALAEFRAAGGKHTWLQSGDAPAANEEDRKAVLKLTPTDGPEVVYEYSMADARAEGLIREKSRWTKRPGNMLRARCITNALGMVCPEIFAGDYADGDSEPAPAANLNLSNSASAVPVPEAKKEAPVIEVQVVKTEPKEDEAELAKMGIAPLVTPQGSTKPEAQKEALSSPAAFAKGPAYSSNGQSLSDDMVSQVENAIGEHAVAAVTWMLKEGWLQKGQGLNCLTSSRANRIIKQRDSFLRAIGGVQ